jgi:hypothetical protein
MTEPDTVAPTRPRGGRHLKLAADRAILLLAGRKKVWVDNALLGFGLVLFAIRTPIIFWDGQHRFDAVRQLVTTGTFSHMTYSFWGPLFSIPLWPLHDLAQTPEWWVSRYNLLLFGLGLGSFWLLLRNIVDHALLSKFLLIMFAASMFPVNVHSFFGETFTALLAGVGLMALALRRTRWAWPAIALGVANTPAAIVGLVLAIARHTWATRRLRYLLIVVAAALLIVLDTLIRLGVLVNSSYATQAPGAGSSDILPFARSSGFGYPLFFGLISILFSFGKGLIFFVPFVLLPMRRRLQALKPELWNGYLLWLLFLAGLVLVYSKWWAWYGGGFWGPRFFLFASIPGSLALAVWLHHPPASVAARVGVLALLALASWTAINGVIFDQPGLSAPAMLRACYGNNLHSEFLCWYTPQFSVLWQPLIHGRHLHKWELAWIAYCVAVFLRLALPHVRDIAHAAGGSWATSGADYFRRGEWGF